MTKKKITCPYCGSERIAEYLYGLYGDDDELEQQEADGKVILAGCVVMYDDPKYHCNDCDKDFGKRDELPM